MSPIKHGHGRLCRIFAVVIAGLVATGCDPQTESPANAADTTPPTATPTATPPEPGLPPAAAEAEPVAPAAPAQAPTAASDPPPDALDDTQLARLIDQTASHPDDPDLPAEFFGASDAVLHETPSQSIATLLRTAGPWLDTPAAHRRHVFALGRAAMMHGYSTRGLALLHRADDMGSAAAAAYLGKHAMDAQDYPAARAHFDRAAAAGFVSVSFAPRLAQLDQRAPVIPPFTPDQLTSDELRLLYAGDFDIIQAQWTQLSALKYIGELSRAVIDNAYVVGRTHPQILTDLDRTLSSRAQRALVSSPEAVNQAMNEGMDQMMAILGAMANERQSGGSPQDEAAAVMGALGEQAGVSLEALAEQDAVCLVQLYASHPDAFQIIYGNMQKYVAQIEAQ